VSSLYDFENVSGPHHNQPGARAHTLFPRGQGLTSSRRRGSSSAIITGRMLPVRAIRRLPQAQAKEHHRCSRKPDAGLDTSRTISDVTRTRRHDRTAATEADETVHILQARGVGKSRPTCGGAPSMRTTRSIARKKDNTPPILAESRRARRGCSRCCAHRFERKSEVLA